MTLQEQLTKRDATCAAAIICNLISENLMPQLNAIDDPTWVKLAAEALELIERIRTDIEHDQSSMVILREMIIDRSYREGEFVLSSGRTSKYFFDLKATMLDAKGANLIADAILQKLKTITCDVIGGPAIGAVPITSVVIAKSYTSSLALGAFYVRQQIKDHGTVAKIDGVTVNGQQAVLIEDVSTTGQSLLAAALAVREAGGYVSDAITVVDRMEGAVDTLKAADITLHALFQRDDFSISNW